MDFLFLVLLVSLIALVLFWAEWATSARKVRRASPPPVERPAPPATIGEAAVEARIAVHEAGHALVALRHTKTLSIDEVVIDPGGRSGHVMHTVLTESVWGMLTVKLAGIAAEMMIYGKARSGDASDDLITARALAEDVVKTGKRSWRGALLAPWDVEGASVDFAVLFTDQPPSKEAVWAMGIAYIKAREILNRHSAAHAKLTSMLLASKKLDQKTLEGWFGDRKMLNVLREAGRDFV